MSARRLIPLATEIAGILGTAVALKLDGKVWIWLSHEQASILYRACPKKYDYQLCDERLSTIETRYPRHALGYVDFPCGRRSPGGIASMGGACEDVLVDARALLSLLEDTVKEWEPSIGLALVVDLVRLAASISTKGAKSRARHDGSKS